jgi:hypothetical protein
LRAPFKFNLNKLELACTIRGKSLKCMAKQLFLEEESELGKDSMEAMVALTTPA